MPSPGEDIQAWSVTATNNGNSDALINWQEHQTRASVNNSARSEMAAHAKNRNLLNGSIVTTGSANAQAFLSGVGYTSVPTGLVVKLKIGGGLTNTASATLNMDGIGAVLIKTSDGNNLLGGELIAGDYVDLIYNGTNWIFLYSRAFLFHMMTEGGGIIIGTQVFSTTGVYAYIPSPRMECCIIECIGGGGAGGGTNDVGTNFASGGGGGAGGYSRKIATAGEIGPAQTVGVGIGGVPVLGGTGGGGGTTGVGSLCTAYGGAGGLAYPQGGSGAGPGVGDIAAAGATGMAGVSVQNQTAIGIGGWGGAGAAGPFGGGGAAAQANSGQAYHGISATGYGSGGGGGNSNAVAVATQGGNGAGGLVIITEFGGRGAPGRDGVNGTNGVNGAQGPAGPIGPPGPAGSGTGDVLVHGTPVAGQLAQWFDTSHIQGVAAGSVVGFKQVVPRIFTTSGTYTPTSGMQYCIIECIGGGGGGGGVVGGSNIFMTGGGGGSGGYSRKVASAALIGASKVVTVGAGGFSGAGGNGTVGGTTSVGSLCVANGGSGGLNNSIPGAGGVATGVGDVTAAGNAGAPGFINNSIGSVAVYVYNGGQGAPSILGGGPLTQSASSGQTFNGTNATTPGAGGCGSATNNVAVNGTGGNGAGGIVIVTEFI